ncbi:MAG: kynureninase [Vicinamibacteria bacterium]|nr:kynureninase [Vicinamibacteria bacterium]
MTKTRTDCLNLDANDRLAPLRAHFMTESVDAQSLIYLDGNSLGLLPRATPARVQEVVQGEWGRDLIRSWNENGWMTLSQRIGDKIAPLLGVGPGEVLVADSTSVNLYKVLSAALALTKADAPRRRLVVADRTDFPSDLYIADSLCRERGFELVLADDQEILSRLDDRVAVLQLTQVNYRTGRRHRMSEITRAAHRAGALVVWDLSHSAGAFPVKLKGEGAAEDVADFAVGCGYKYLNGGPGAPAFVWANPAHTQRMDREHTGQPLSGWLGHEAPFEFEPDYRPGTSMSRFLCGTPPILSLAALECGVDVFQAALALGGLNALCEKSIALTGLFIDLVESRCAGQGLTLVTPRRSDERGSQVCFSHESGAFAIMKAVIERNVIGDFRAPNILRFGFAPLYTRFVDVWDAVDRLETVLRTSEWRDARFSLREAVT